MQGSPSTQFWQQKTILPRRTPRSTAIGQPHFGQVRFAMGPFLRSFAAAWMSVVGVVRRVLPGRADLDGTVCRRGKIDQYHTSMILHEDAGIRVEQLAQLGDPLGLGGDEDALRAP